MLAPTATSRSGVRPLVAVCVTFAAASLIAVPAGLGLGWDEVVYVSQHGHHAPAAFMSAPRAHGVTLLVWPVASWLDSTIALRLYLTLSAAASLGLAFGVWSRLLRRPGIAALAAGLYASLWIALFYANAAMPTTTPPWRRSRPSDVFCSPSPNPPGPGRISGWLPPSRWPP